MAEPNTTYLLSVRCAHTEETRRFRARLGAFLEEQARAGAIRAHHVARLYVLEETDGETSATRLTLDAPVEAAA